MTKKVRKLRILVDLLRIGVRTPLHPIRLILKGRRTKTMQYPTTLPLEAIQRSIATVKARTISQNKVQFASDVWNIQGYVQGVTIGSPSVGSSSPGDEIGAEHEEAMEELCNCMAVSPDLAPTYAAAGPSDAESIPPIVIQMGVQMLIQLITEWLANRKKK